MIKDQTRRSLKHLLTEYQCALKKGDVATSAPVDHALETGHPVDLTNYDADDRLPSLYNQPLPLLRAGTFSTLQAH